MSKPYSQDLRERAVTAVSEGRSRHAVAKLFRVSVSSVIRWTQVLRPPAAPQPSRWAESDVMCWASNGSGCASGWRKSPDLTLKALRAELAERGCKVSLWAGHSTMRDVCSHTGAQAAVRLTPIALFPCWEKPR